MPIAAQIRAEIEALLATRIPSALTSQPRVIRPTVATGIGALDDLLGSGLPIGAISEIVGQECSGRTTLALALLAQITRQGKVCAWIDVSDMLHPASVAASGVDLERLLWVRCGGELATTAQLNRTSPSAIEAPQTTKVQLGGNSPHPRSESKGLPSAINELLSAKTKYKRDKTIGTPGAPNRTLTAKGARVDNHLSNTEQVASDRQPSRRGSYVLGQREACEPRCYEPLAKARLKIKRYPPLQFEEGEKRALTHSSTKPWSRLDQALRVTDLLLQAGGFSAIVLDMSSIAAEFTSRIPQATWFRYRAAAERTQSSFLLLTQHACAKSSAEVVLRLGGSQAMQAGETVFTGLKIHSQIERNRFKQDSSNVVPIRKPPQRADVAEWRTRTVWTGRRKAEHR